MAQIGVVGAGYVGLVTAACLADMGHRVSVIEQDARKVASLRLGDIPIAEEGLEALWARGLKKGSLTITGSYAQGLRSAEFIFVCVGTPSGEDGVPDLSYVLYAAEGIALHAEGQPTVVLKSTVPVGTGATVAETIAMRHPSGRRFQVASNPEFLREGYAVADFLHPDRIVVGATDPEIARAVASLYEGLDAPIILTDSRTAELIKYASNAFLATKISFMNEIAGLCESVDVDVSDVSRGMGMDPRIGPKFLAAGLGWGGSCLPKDTKALKAMGIQTQVEMPLLSAAMRVNEEQPRRVTDKLDTLLGGLSHKTVALWGLTFKEGTDDFRESPAIALAQALLARGCAVRVYDPVAATKSTPPMEGVSYSQDPYQAAEGASAVVLATAWPEFLHMDMSRVLYLMDGNVFIDARNALVPSELRGMGFVYEGIGRNGATQGHWAPHQAAHADPDTVAQPVALRVG
ncbi:MAG: UDP-glucose dehydrogenase family protein [Chloroflexota bacterium]